MAVVDTLTETRGGQSPKRFTAIVFMPTRWLSGKGPRKPFLVGWSGLEATPQATVNQLRLRAPTSAILFVRRVPLEHHLTQEDTKWAALMPPTSNQIEWIINQSPYDWREGIYVQTVPGQMDSVETAIDGVMKESTLEGLAARADLVVIASVNKDKHTCLLDGNPSNCTTYRIEQVVTGSLRENTIDAYAVFDLRPVPRRALLFLLQKPDGIYEILGAIGQGGSEIVDDSIPAFGVTVQTAIAIARSHKGRSSR